MKIRDQSFQFEHELNGNDILKSIERIGRTCYKSEDRITNESAAEFVSMLIARGHEAMIEHSSITVRIITDRGISHELVRHRIASYAQESTRYCNYSKEKFGGELTFIRPVYWHRDEVQFGFWEMACKCSEQYYFTMVNNGATAQEARSVLPNSLKTEIVMTMNLREWRHFFKVRCDKAAHPQMRELATIMLRGFSRFLPPVFGDIVI